MKHARRSLEHEHALAKSGSGPALVAHPLAPRGNRRARSHSAVARRDEVVRLALGGVPVCAIAKRVGIHRMRVWSIMNEPDVRARIETARATALDDARALLRQSTLRAVEVLAELMESDRPMVALRAAAKVLDLAGIGQPSASDRCAVDRGLAGATDVELEELVDEYLGRAVATRWRVA